jgi:hypothetical protein
MADRRPSRPATVRRLLLPMALLAAACIPTGATAQQVAVVPVGMMSTPGDKGAQIYCFMRDNGNNHQVSWDAAYEVIKRQGSGLFRTSPQHAAVMITESVVQSPASFPNCGMYLGDLYREDETQAAPHSGGGAITRSERYGY